MWLGLFECFSILLTGIVIKVLDDYLDRADQNLTVGSRELGGVLIYRFSRGVLPYALLLFLLALTLNRSIATALFLSAYAIGMFGSESQVLPSGLSSRTESIGALILGAALTDMRLMAVSFAAICAVQAADAIVDRQQDKEEGHRSWYYRYGSIETWLILILSLLVGLYLDYKFIIVVLFITLVIVYLFSWQVRGGDGKTSAF